VALMSYKAFVIQNGKRIYYKTGDIKPTRKELYSQFFDWQASQGDPTGSKMIDLYDGHGWEFDFGTIEIKFK
jgi:hypothetical protein